MNEAREANSKQQDAEQKKYEQQVEESTRSAQVKQIKAAYALYRTRQPK